MQDRGDVFGYRAIRNIATGEIATPLATVYAEDWPYGNLHPSQPLGRYMDYSKFEDLLKTQELYFRRVDQFAKKDDPLEGALSPKGVHGTSASDATFQAATKIQQNYADQVKYREVAKACSFINCWHINDNENPLMWERYTKSSDSVLVITTVERLSASLKKRVFGSTVKYVDISTPRTEFDERSLFFYKDKSFAFEQEFRLLVDLMMMPGESIRHDHPDDFFRRIPVDLSMLILGIQLHPAADSATKEKVKRIVTTYLPSAKEA